MFHELTIVGSVGRDPDLRYSADGKASCTISVAANRTIAQGQKETIWFKVTAWEKMAEYINQYVRKGAKVFLKGRLYPDKTTGGPRIYTKNDGTSATSFEVVATELRVLDYGQNAVQNQQQQYQQQPKQQAQPRQTSMMDDGNIAW